MRTIGRLYVVLFRVPRLTWEGDYYLFGWSGGFTALCLCIKLRLDDLRAPSELQLSTGVGPLLRASLFRIFLAFSGFGYIRGTYTFE